MGARAASEEIQVYTDTLSQPGGVGMDIHHNFVASGSNAPEYPGGRPPLHVYRATPEFYYGISPTLELGLYVLGAAAQSQSGIDGAKVRLKYIAPHDVERGGYWGANLEIGRTRLRASEVPWNTEFKAIFGYRAAPWEFAFNANFGWAGAGVMNSPVSLSVSSKAAYRLKSGTQIGVESYNELGLVRSLGGLSRQSQVLYFVVDTEIGKMDLNAGIGRGLTNASDRWTIKLITGFEF